MIVAGLVLLVVGAADLVRQFVERRWIGYLVVAAAALVIGGLTDAVLPAVAALAAGAGWVWSMPDRGESRMAFWPAVALGAITAAAVLWLGDRGPAGVLGGVWRLDTPFGEVSADLALLVLGVVAFLLESGNVVVRAALAGEHAWHPAEVGFAGPTAASEPSTPRPESSAPGSEPSASASAVPPPAAVPAPLTGGFKGGRLIGPLERLIVFLLTLATAYSLLAAMLAAKGIVRFPEISRDGETGARAEYFLVGSLVSWVIALAAAFLVWWSVNA
ncbi:MULTISPECIES: hypothetical protein [Microbacterium]|uniref:hypothetical protein n=1 Tax=Microbacterium TaxID=33882 RepID=UPI00217CF328|nr:MULTISPECIES: hypothetical protein [Microbacterium]UWF76844.1 hypothetical protein JSY13_08350 [Microbacterium neungamense]WCM54999.1 hypothetical protein JRG78_08345 [Microbacterium sp. EF45047]